jgi:hypothetical protein
MYFSTNAQAKSYNEYQKSNRACWKKLSFRIRTIRGVDRFHSIEALHELYGMSYRDAARTIHESAVWQDTRDEHERFEVEVDEVLLELAQEHKGAIRFGPDSPP